MNYYQIEDYIFSLIGHIVFFSVLFWAFRKNIPKPILILISKLFNFVFASTILKSLNFIFFPLEKLSVLLNRKAPAGLKDIEKVKKANERGKLFEEYIAENMEWLGESFTTGDLRKLGRIPDAIKTQSGCGEHGVDNIVFLDKKYQNKLFDNKFDALLIQSKFYNKPISNSAVQEIVGAKKMYSEYHKKIFKLMVITNQTFTDPAKNLAKSNDVLLVDKDSLRKWLKKI